MTDITVAKVGPAGARLGSGTQVSNETNDAPPYLEKMRKLGWPPGWTSQRYNRARNVWETVPSIPKASFPGVACPVEVEAERGA